jgi:hypothetical protein
LVVEAEVLAWDDDIEVLEPLSEAMVELPERIDLKASKNALPRAVAHIELLEPAEDSLAL